MASVDRHSLLAAAAVRRPRGAAVICGATTLDYPGLRALAERMGGAMAEAGAQPGDRVAALFPNCHRYLACYFAALDRGYILLPLNLRLLPDEMRGLLEHGGARLVVGDPDLLALLSGHAGMAARAHEDGWAIARLPERPTPPESMLGKDAAHLYYTSGTTGRPKGVVLTRANLLAHLDMTLHELALTDDTRAFKQDMFHTVLWTVTAAAGTHVMLRRFDPEAACDLIEAAGVTLTNLVPAMIPGLLDAAARGSRRLRSLRLLMSGGAPVAPRLVARIGEILACEYVQTYGLTETSPFLTFSLLDEGLRRLPPGEQLRLRARTGRPARGVEVRLVSPPGAERFEDVPADDATVGEVIARGPTVTPGYFRDLEATREAFRGGWFHTGDLGTIDRRGFINLVDRAKDMIVTGGETVYSTEVEHLLHEHEAVGEVAVFAVPDETRGESVHAAVVLAAPDASTSEALIAFCRERMAHFKCPRGIDFVASLPRTGSGKIDKRALREPFWRGHARRIN